MGIGLKYKDQKHTIDEKEKGGVPYLSFPLLEETGIVNQGFSTRLGGVSKGGCASMNISIHRGDDPEAVEENRRRIAAAIGVDREKMVYTCQTHTTNVALVTEEDARKSLPETDGMITETAGAVPCHLLRGLCSPLLCGPGPQGGGAFPLRMEGDGAQYGGCDCQKDGGGIWKQAGGYPGCGGSFDLPGLL